MIVVDEEVSSVGTANIDVRSFKLNFEVNAFIYDEGMAETLTRIFIRMSKYAGSLQLKSLKSDQSGFVLKSPLQGWYHRYYNILNKRTITTWSVQTVDKFEKIEFACSFFT